MARPNTARCPATAFGIGAIMGFAFRLRASEDEIHEERTDLRVQAAYDGEDPEDVLDEQDLDHSAANLAAADAMMDFAITLDDSLRYAVSGCGKIRLRSMVQFWINEEELHVAQNGGEIVLKVADGCTASCEDGVLTLSNGERSVTIGLA